MSRSQFAETSLGLLEVRSFSAAIVALDAAIKAASVRVVQIEMNDLPGVCVKLSGEPGDLTAALVAGHAAAETMQVSATTSRLNAPDDETWRIAHAPQEYSSLIEQETVFESELREYDMAEQVPYAIGMIETQGLTALIEATDAACKAAAVEVIGKEKLGGGYVTVLLRGDVAAVKAAVDAARARVEATGLGKLIATHVIAHPCAATLSILPKNSDR